MRKKNNNKLVLILLLLICISLGFAVLTTTLQINGLTKIKGNTWDVYFENVQVKDGSVEADVPEISDKTTVSFDVELDVPGDFYEFNVDVKNNGTIDAMIDSINKSELTLEQSVYLDYSVTGVSNKALLGAGKKKTITVNVTFKDVDASQLPSVTEPIKLTLSFNAFQADSNAIHSGVSLEDTNGNGKADVGELVSVGTERFYVISNNDGEVRALAEWNLLVGNQNDGSNVTPLANPTGLQDSRARGIVLKDGINIKSVYDNEIDHNSAWNMPYIGTVSFSSSKYWNGSDGDLIDLNNDNNYIVGYLNFYNNSLKELGLETKNVTLITMRELESLGCLSGSFPPFINTCENAPTWVSQTSYWTRSIFNNETVRTVGSYDGLENRIYSHDLFIGVRPVIVFDESLIG